jgi:hypothetical protein
MYAKANTTMIVVMIAGATLAFLSTLYKKTQMDMDQWMHLIVKQSINRFFMNGKCMHARTCAMVL